MQRLRTKRNKEVRNIEIIKLNLQDIKRDSTNPRIVTEAQKELYKKLVAKFGMILPVIITEDYVSCFDDAKLEAAAELGIEEVNCVKITDLSPEEMHALRIGEIHAIELGEWDYKQLLHDLEMLGDEFLELTGFNIEDVMKQIDEEFEDLDDIKEIDIPEEPIKPFTKHEDIYYLGKHKLMCGDSTKAQDVDKLMAGEKAILMVTDPPYNINYESERGMKIENDNLSKDEFYQFLYSAYCNAERVLEEGGAFYIFYAESEVIAFRDALEKAGLKYSQTLVWVKNAFNLSRQDYNWKHEPCLYGWKLGKAHYFIKDFTQDTELQTEEILKKMSKKELIQHIIELEEKAYTTVIRENKPLKNDVHPTMKPIKLLARLIANSSKKGWKVIDLFGGSGSTLIACEQLNRQAFLMEYDPVYADVIVKRYASMGKEDIKLIRNGVEYSWEAIKEEF